jgi:hypothetical protein
MPKESNFTNSFKKALEDNHFFVMKIRGQSSAQGQPDCFIAKAGKGFFAEIKVDVRKKIPQQYINKSIFLPNGKIQMMTMMGMAGNFLARYILFIKTESTSLIFLIRPSEVFNLVEYDKPIDLVDSNLISKGKTQQKFIESLHDFLQISLDI